MTSDSPQHPVCQWPLFQGHDSGFVGRVTPGLWRHRLTFEKLSKGRRDLFQCVRVCCCLPVTRLGKGGKSIPLVSQGPGTWLLSLAWHRCGAAGTHWALPHLSQFPLPVMGSAYFIMYFCIHAHINSCVCVHVYAYLHVYTARCGFTEKCESSWPQ